ncbi:uncharacterized protein LOC105794246 [Gossypium raimondii]|uniref:Reverse transcriptase zinc-binding domain-containing protein n=1 Tax=Gossypium raimondii TaxID=29730 RepID=A0A7J8NPJ6_GOSRA|nr:uncharacterized protein LOC105794246 [Gossypium raimondii]MBA0578911.1 hypothetical protein [Gossypium raimondii]
MSTVMGLKVEGPWSLLWNVDVPLKVKDFLWRCLRRFILCKGRLAERGFPIDSLCPRCGGVESIESILLKCPIMLDAWRVLGPVETASNDVFLRSVLSMAADVTSFTIVSVADHFLKDGKEARNVLAGVQQATARTIVHDCSRPTLDSASQKLYKCKRMLSKMLSLLRLLFRITQVLLSKVLQVYVPLFWSHA